MIKYIIIGVILLIVLYLILVINTFIKYRNKVKEAFSTMDVCLKKRFDLIPSLVETVKGYAKHESTTLEEVIKLRNTPYDKQDINEKVDLNESVSKNVTKLMILAESYPELKANENFHKLSDELIEIENELSKSRRYYNGCVRQYNNKVEVFPNNIFATLFGFKSYKMFEIETSEKENINIEL